jgi:hypothetical protein
VPSSPEALAQPRRGALPRQIWAVALGSDSVARLRSNTLVRLRSSGINTAVAIDLSERQLTRLRNLNRRAGMRLLVPQRASTCRRTASATCVLETRSRAAARRLGRQRGVDLVLVRVSGPKELDAISARRGRILALAELGRGRFNVSTWRRAIDRAANDPRLDLAVQPLGRVGERALTSYLSVFAPGRAPRLREVDGGPSYYAQFAKSFPTDPSYFMIAVWCRPWHTRAQIDQYKDFGLNTGICLENPELTNEALLRANGIKAIIQAEERRRFNDVGSETVGWHSTDEIDMTRGENACPSELDAAKQSQRIPNDRRMIHNNYGKGVGTWSERGFGSWTDAKAACYVNYQDLTSIDTYWFTDPNEASLPQYEHGWGYGQDIARLRRLDAIDGRRHPQFAWVETGPAGFGSHRRILPAELRSAVWHTIIAGARGVGYFDHNFGSPAGQTCHGSTIRGRCFPGTRAMGKAVNQQIKGLAPVINSPFVTSGYSLSGSPTRRMVKWHAASGKFYVFLGTENGGRTTFSMPCVGDATATRLAPSNLPGEAASIPMTGGAFSDSFADKNAVHIYRIDRGSSCGLT